MDGGMEGWRGGGAEGRCKILIYVIQSISLPQETVESTWEEVTHRIF